MLCHYNAPKTSDGTLTEETIIIVRYLVVDLPSQLSTMYNLCEKVGGRGAIIL